jgi:hypothetical protein
MNSEWKLDKATQHWSNHTIRIYHVPCGEWTQELVQNCLKCGARCPEHYVERLYKLRKLETLLNGMDHF